MFGEGGLTLTRPGSRHGREVRRVVLLARRGQSGAVLHPPCRRHLLVRHGLHHRHLRLRHSLHLRLLPRQDGGVLTGQLLRHHQNAAAACITTKLKAMTQPTAAGSC